MRDLRSYAAHPWLFVLAASQYLHQDSKIRSKFSSLPQLPEAGMFDALEPQVVAERRRVLQKYLDALVDTESICDDRQVHIPS